MKNDKWKMENQIASESLAECLADKKFPTNRKGIPVGGDTLDSAGRQRYPIPIRVSFCAAWGPGQAAEAQALAH
jgi:hypothetical protein